ncbi:hypothetical protein Dthio_PD0706 [Desulfonatronospira thiodismutans ASO3-1]|uniref:Uncharacterized protein n=1 Tax=Desulfonatronospira thiodismutans ASO3-1 TaxID=555779 RepID=D6SRR0_9BACT|nr:hypothetical protein [Desulfonatronospira thiodismutans]EFI33376.1 hypothetical protein Dthio_PD0706 [Desulfonatronospira thiodismutans ASO3-1]
MIIRQYGIENKNPLRARNPATLEHNPRQAGDLPSYCSHALSRQGGRTSPGRSAAQRREFAHPSTITRLSYPYEIGRAGTLCISWGRRGRRNTPVY